MLLQRCLRAHTFRSAVQALYSMQSVQRALRKTNGSCLQETQHTWSHIHPAAALEVLQVLAGDDIKGAARDGQPLLCAFLLDQGHEGICPTAEVHHSVPVMQVEGEHLGDLLQQDQLGEVAAIAAVPVPTRYELRPNTESLHAVLAVLAGAVMSVTTPWLLHLNQTFKVPEFSAPCCDKGCIIFVYVVVTLASNMNSYGHVCRQCSMRE